MAVLGRCTVTALRGRGEAVLVNKYRDLRALLYLDYQHSLSLALLSFPSPFTTMSSYRRWVKDEEVLPNPLSPLLIPLFTERTFLDSHSLV